MAGLFFEPLEDVGAPVADGAADAEALGSGAEVAPAQGFAVQPARWRTLVEPACIASKQIALSVNDAKDLVVTISKPNRSATSSKCASSSN